MRENLITTLKWILRVLAKWTLAKYGPSVIGVTGTVGKTSTKEAVYAVVKNIRSMRASSGNFNNEIGLPLTILGSWPRIAGKLFWVRVILASLWRLAVRGKYPEVLVLEYAADRPGDLRYLLEITRPQIGIVTAVGDIPVHVEFYSGPDAVAREKARLIEALPAQGFAMLNFDDEAVLGMRERTRSHVMTFGFGEGADVRVTNFENRSENGRPAGIAFKLEYGGNFVPVRVDDAFGKAQAYAAAAAALVGIAFGMNLVKISEALGSLVAPPQRMKIMAGVKKSYIIDDSYNASPMAMRAAIEAVRSLPRKARKIAVLGDMLEIGKYTIEAHEMMGRYVAKGFHALVTVGPRAKFIAEEACKMRMPKSRIFAFDNAEEAGKKVQELLKQGDVVLVKGSRAMHLEKVVEELRQI